MRLIARKTPYSSVVGGGLSLQDETGRMRFLISICGTTQGITKEEDREISEQLVALIGDRGIAVSAREPGTK
jgi:hypothetical protein